jgi:hypothetical protein
MKNLICLMAVIMSALLIALVISLPVSAVANSDHAQCSSIKADHIEAKSITVDNGKKRITITSGGIWISKVGESTPCVSIYFDDITGPQVGIHGKHPNGKGYAACIGTHKDGQGFLQLAGDSDGDVKQFTLEKLRK